MITAGMRDAHGEMIVGPLWLRGWRIPAIARLPCLGARIGMRSLCRILLSLLLACVAVPGLAQQNAPKAPSEQDRQAEEKQAWQAASAVAVRGPASVPLRDQASLALPQGMVFIPQAEAARLSRAMGNRPGDSLVGIVTSAKDDEQWLVFVGWVAEGYVRDDESQDLDADTVLQGLRDAMEEANKDRAARGFPELDILGWNEPPRYDAGTHFLSWSVSLKEKGAADSDRVVNFNTRALGRNGHFSLNLVTHQDSFTKNRAVSATLLSGLGYDEGKRYADFNSSTDHVAEYGLMALIGVAAAKKLGLLAVAAAFVLKFAKVGVVAVGAMLLGLRRLFQRKPRP